MCGSGTIAIEAALIATKTAPGLIKYYDKNRSLMSSPQSSATNRDSLNLPAPTKWFDTRVDAIRQWKEVVGIAVRSDERTALLQNGKVIFANDWNPSSLELAKQSAVIAGVDHLIEFSGQDIEKCDVSLLLRNIYRERTESNGAPLSEVMLMTNPPWDMRLNEGAVDSWMKYNSFVQRLASSARTTETINATTKETSKSSLFSRLRTQRQARELNQKIGALPAFAQVTKKTILKVNIWTLTGNESLLRYLTSLKTVDNFDFKAAGVAMKFIQSKSL